MTQTIEVEVDEAGRVHPTRPDAHLPQGRALLVWDDAPDMSSMLLAEPALADWLRPEEDEAWAHLQPEK
jgi:hypothetical protein